MICFSFVWMKQLFTAFGVWTNTQHHCGVSNLHTHHIIWYSSNWNAPHSTIIKNGISAIVILIIIIGTSELDFISHWLSSFLLVEQLHRSVSFPDHLSLVWTRQDVDESRWRKVGGTNRLCKPDPSLSHFSPTRGQRCLQTATLSRYKFSWMSIKISGWGWLKIISIIISVRHHLEVW